MDCKKWEERLRALCLCPGGAGAEGEVTALLADMLSPWGRAKTDALGNLSLTIGQGERHLLLDAHIDQVGLMVTAVLDDGFVRVAPCGGVDRRTLMGQRVTLAGREAMTGVVCSMPPHLQKEMTGKVPPIDEMAVDLCRPEDEVRESVRPGDRLYCAPVFTPLLHDRVTATALDNRAGAAILIAALEHIEPDRLLCRVTLLFSTREETGEQGARVSSYAEKPDEAVIVDTSFARAPGVPEMKSAPLGGGVMIGCAATLDRRMGEALIELCGEDIAHSLEVMGGVTGTNADVIGVSRGGVPACTLSVPIRNMHTPAEAAALSDLDAAARLLGRYAMRGGAGPWPM